MSSLFEQAEGISIDKPAPTKPDNATSGKGSGADMKPSALPGTKSLGGQKPDVTDQKDKAVKMPVPGTQTPTPGMKKVQSGIEYFQP